MSDNIPFDIQMEIIKRVVDVTSLIRFRSVSKPWKCFIDSPEFIAFYGTRDTQPHRLLLRYTPEQYGQVKYVSFADDEQQQQQQLDFAPNVPFFIKQFNNSHVIGSSCGLWCFHGRNAEMVVIWNPSIRKRRAIMLPDELSGTCRCYTLCGFGVCPSTFDPTIVGISWHFWGCMFEVGIYTLSSNTWKMLPSSNMPRESIKLTTSNRVAIAIDRFIYWHAYDIFVGNRRLGREIKNLILSFDLITHEFKEVDLPDSIAYHGEVPVDISISELNGSLVVSAYTNEVNDGRVYGVWMMGEEGGVMTPFTKLFNIKTPHDLSISKVLGFTRSGEPILETNKDSGGYATVDVYKPCSELIIEVGIKGRNDSFFICPYAETLHLIDTSNGCIEF